MPDPDIVISLDAPGRLLAIRGRLGAATVADVRAALIGAIAAGHGDLVVDIEEAEIADASGLGVLVSAHRLALRSDRRLVLRAVPARVDRLLAVTHLNRVLTVEAARSVPHPASA